jgi:hypothetical protein
MTWAAAWHSAIADQHGTGVQVQLNLWVAGYYADASSSLDSVAKELEAWLVSLLMLSDTHSTPCPAAASLMLAPEIPHIH